jgi:hypothetical protein
MAVYKESLLFIYCSFIWLNNLKFVGRRKSNFSFTLNIILPPLDYVTGSGDTTCRHLPPPPLLPTPLVLGIFNRNFFKGRKKKDYF